ncbi:MAG: 4Fe-4S dicluster domain-containing protein [Candidatus Moranbacteria bacterium]|nr:4Fe-4S dicluster domain-containing protein [Candidatus Moranbacteria bacterium]
MEKGATIKHDIKKASKTGTWRNVRPEIEVSGCIGCATCVKYCPDACISLRKRKKDEFIEGGKATENVAEIGYEFCKGCGVCAEVCPVKTISMKKE